MANVSQLFIELRHLHQIGVAQAQPDRLDTVLFRPGEQGFVGGARQCAGNNVDLIGRRHAQAVLLFHRQRQLFHQLVDHTSAAVNDQQRTLMGAAIGQQRVEQARQRLFAVEQHAAQFDN